MRYSRRIFLRTAGAATVLAGPAIRRSQADVPFTQHQELKMEIKRAGSQPSSKGPADWFTGTVRIDPLFQTSAPARAVGASVTFEPGARTAWHTHPLGQTLIVTAGSGFAQREGGPVEEIRPGDVVWFEAGEKHWHGATPTPAMTHIAIQEALDGKAVEWMEKVSDEQYQAKSRAR
jgi:quercetin dioxygenase-like cupin family protein